VVRFLIDVKLRRSDALDVDMTEEVVDPNKLQDVSLLLRSSDELMILECASILKFACRIHKDVRVTGSPYSSVLGSDEITATFTVAVMWDKESLCYNYNEGLSTLMFPLSPLQIWLMNKEKTLRETQIALEDDQNKSALAKSEVIPYCLVNHLLCQVRLRKLSKELTPIVLCENCEGIVKTIVVPHFSGCRGASTYYIGGLSGICVETTTPESEMSALLDSVVAKLYDYILHRKPAYFCYGYIIQPCTFVDSFSFVYEVSFVWSYVFIVRLIVLRYRNVRFLQRLNQKKRRKSRRTAMNLLMTKDVQKDR